jgi:hypothetical protein
LNSISLAVLLFFTVLMVFEEIPDALMLLRSTAPQLNEHTSSKWEKKGRAHNSLWRRIERVKFEILVLTLDATAVRTAQWKRKYNLMI